jgi:serine/threonine protein kinase
LFASINTQLGLQPSRRDDMESLGYCLMKLLRGSLPWQGMKASSGQEQRRRICERKQKTIIEGSLCLHYPSEFQEYFNYCRGLKFDEEPNYAYLKQLFRDLFHRLGFVNDGIYDWDIKKAKEGAGKCLNHIEFKK